MQNVRKRLFLKVDLTFHRGGGGGCSFRVRMTSSFFDCPENDISVYPPAFRHVDDAMGSSPMSAGDIE